MSQTQLLQGSFTSGELSPDLSARTDFFRYANGCRRLKNFWVQAHGGASKRPGFVMIGGVPGDAALVPFVFNTEQSYCLIFGEGWMRVCTVEGFILAENGRVFELASPYSLEQARRLSWAQSGDVLFLACRGVKPQKLKRLGHRHWEFEDMDFMPDVAAPTWVVPDRDYELIPKYTAAYPAYTVYDILGAIVPYNLYKMEQVPNPIDVEGHAIFYNKAVNSSGKISPATRNTVYTYYVTAVSKNTGRESLLSEANIVTGPASNNWQVGDYIHLEWAADKNAREYRVYKGESGSTPGHLATTLNTYFDDINIIADYSNGIRTTRDPFSPKEGEEGLGREYPGVVCFFEQRLVYASSVNQPQTLWLSATGEYNNFSTHSPLQADDAIELGIASNEVSPLQWMVAMRSLLTGGSGMEWEVTSSDGGAFSAGNARAVAQSRRGSSPLRALVVGSTILHVTRSGREIRDFQYDFGTDSYSGKEKTVLASHLFEKWRIIGWDYQPLPHSIIWVVREDGALLGLTYNAEHEVYAWHRHSTQGEFKSVCSLPCSADDRLFVLVRRGEGYFVEYMAPQFIADAENSRPGVYLDAAQELESATPVSSISGLEHLEGREVEVWADGALYARTVRNGVIELDKPARRVITGLAYSAELETMPLELEVAQGTSSGRKKKVSAINIHFKNSFAAEVGTDFEHLEKVKWPEQNGAPLMYSGIQRVITGALAGNLVTACVKSDKPYPLTVLAVMPEISVY